MKSSTSSSALLANSNSNNSFITLSRVWAVLCLLIVISTVISARPASSTIQHSRQKRQSDQRLAELETLLALQKYNGHRVRGWQSHSDLSPGFGLIDFDKIGRRKKSTRFSPGNRIGSAVDGESSNNNDEAPAPGSPASALWAAWIPPPTTTGGRNHGDLESQVDQK